MKNFVKKIFAAAVALNLIFGAVPLFGAPNFTDVNETD